MGRIFRLVLLLLGSGQAVFGAEQWFRFSSSNFELYSTAGEKKGREAILYFEQVRGLFQTLAKSRSGGPATPVRIIAFDSEKSYKPYRINDFATAYYLGARDRDYIVMRSIAPENYPTAIHEYFHLIVKHSGLVLPMWLNEGLADVYSTLEPHGKHMRMGEMIPGHMDQLRSTDWLSLEALLSIGHDSPYYNERDKASIFYSESWALSHMLFLSDGYRNQFFDFLDLIKSGVAQRVALERAFGKSPDDVMKDLEQYLRGGSFTAPYFDVKLDKAAETPEARPATALESGLALAELLSITHKKDAANAAYEKLAQEYPKDPEIELAWARLAWINGQHDEIKRHFERAIALGTSNGKVYFDYAMMSRDRGAADAEVYALLLKAAELQPDLDEAHYFLGFYAATAGRFDESVAQLSQVKHLEKELAFPYYKTLAYADYRVGKFDEAKLNAERAAKSATDPKDAALAKELQAYVSNQSQPAAQRRLIVPERIEGLLQQVDCLGKSKQLRILVDGAAKSFLLQDGTHADLTCGPQKSVKVALEYVPHADPDYGTEGLVRSIEFR